MANEYTYLNRRDIAGSGLGSDPKTIAAFESLQQAAYEDNPAATDAAQQSADQAQSAADGAQTSADAAQSSADAAQTSAATAQGRADDAYDLAQTKVTKNAGPVFTAPAGSVSRAALPAYTAPTASATYDPAQLQALMAQVEALTLRVSAVITDLRANGALTPS
jgi:trimeric autotransporter adhesin